MIVKRMPIRFDRKHAQTFYKDVRPLVNSDRPQIVFEMSQTEYMDSGGVDVLLRCLREAIKCDGEVKLAGVRQSVSIVLELTRVGRLFGSYEDSAEAVKSFHGVPPNVGTPPRVAHEAVRTITPDETVADGNSDGNKKVAA